MAKTKDGSEDDRLMTLPELARYLHVGEKTALRLAASKKVPGFLVGNQWRFKRVAVDEWLEQQLTGESDDFEEIPDGMLVPLGDLLPDDAVVSDLRANDSLTVIEELAARAYSAGWLADKPWFVGALVERESLASTAMEGGVAFLHTRARDMGKIARPFIICGRSYEGIDFGAPDGKPTYIFFLLGLKYDRLHLPILGRLARLLRDSTTIAKLRAQPNVHKMRALLLEEDQKAMSGAKPLGKRSRAQEPVLDRQMRLRKIMRVQAQRKHDERKEEAAKQKPARKRKSATSKSAPKAKSTKVADAAEAKPAVAAKATAAVRKRKKTS